MLEGICWRYRTGSPWRDVPEEFGPWKTVWKRHFRWSTDGTYRQMMDAVQDAGLADEGTQDAVERLLAVDSTVVRAHQHAACARHDSATAQGAASLRATKGALSNYTNPPPEPADHGLGRSRGGFSTKIHTLADRVTATVQVRLTGGQAGDNPQLMPLLDH